MNLDIIYSISSNPGVFGVTLYNYLFKELKLNYIYKSVSIKEMNTLHKLLDVFIETEMIYAISISMPFKKEVFNYLNIKKTVKYKPSNIKAFNSIKKSSNSIEGRLTDSSIFKFFLHSLPKDIEILFVYGDGAMAYLAKSFFTNFKIISLPRLFDSNVIYNQRKCAFINATPLNLEDILSLDLIDFPVLDLPVRFDFINTNKNILTGVQATKIQFADQFHFYTNIEINKNQVDHAFKNAFKQ